VRLAVFGASGKAGRHLVGQGPGRRRRGHRGGPRPHPAAHPPPAAAGGGGRRARPGGDRPGGGRRRRGRLRPGPPPPRNRSPVHRPKVMWRRKASAGGEPRAAGMQPRSRSRRGHVPQPCTASGRLVRRQAPTAWCSWRSAALRQRRHAARGDRAHGASLLSAALLAGRHCPLAAHSPAHRRASKRQVRLPILPFQTGPASRRLGCQSPAR
jgi:hypothetical protein